MAVQYWVVFKRLHRHITMISRCVQQSNQLLNLNQNWIVLPSNCWKWKRHNLVSIYFMRGKRIFPYYFFSSSFPSISNRWSVFYRYVGTFFSFFWLFRLLSSQCFFISLLRPKKAIETVRQGKNVNENPRERDFCEEKTNETTGRRVKKRDKMVLMVWHNNSFGIISQFKSFVTNSLYLKSLENTWFSIFRSFIEITQSCSRFFFLLLFLFKTPASKEDSYTIFRDAAALNMTESGYVWIVTEQALNANNTPDGVIGLQLVHAKSEKNHIRVSVFIYVYVYV